MKDNKTPTPQTKYWDWKLCNEMLNIVRKAKGIPLRPATDNPYGKRKNPAN